jgi:hypothetical protein
MNLNVLLGFRHEKLGQSKKLLKEFVMDLEKQSKMVILELMLTTPFFTFLQADGKMFPMTENTLKVRKQVMAVK